MFQSIFSVVNDKILSFDQSETNLVNALLQCRRDTVLKFIFFCVHKIVLINKFRANKVFLQRNHIFETVFLYEKDDFIALILGQ